MAIEHRLEVPVLPFQDDDLRHLMSRFFEVSTDGILLLDREYRFTFLNRKAESLLAPQGQILGTSIFDSFPAIVYDGSPCVENYTRTMEQRVPTDFESFYPDPLNLWFRIQSYPAVDGIMLFFRDITPEKLGSEALRQKIDEAQRQHAEIETVYRTAPIGLALFDTTDFRYLRLNDRQAAFFGLTPEQIVGRTLTEMAPNVEGLRELFEQVLRGQPVVNHAIEGSLVTDPEDHRYWTVSYFPVYGPDGSIQAITAASLEVTQQKKAQMALLESEKLAVVGRLASSIAHEINNPLESVTNLLYLARTSDDLTEVREFLDIAERELRRASAITTQTLRFHKQTSNPRAVTPAEIFDSVLSIYQGRIVNSGVTVERADAVDRPVHCFDAEVRQVLSNLINNALDAIVEGHGRLVLRSREGTNWANGESGVYFTIADTGAGMSPHTLARIFTPFFTTKGITGTGLGLWVSQEIVARHRGLLRVRSNQAPGTHGTVFTLFLPFAAVTR